MKTTNTTLVTIALMVATFLTAIEGTVVSTAMPKIVSELQGIQSMNWVFSIYLLVSAVTVPIFGKLSDLFGRKVIFIIGTVIFMIGSALCGLSQTMTQLIVFRAIQGIGAGAVTPLTSIIIGDIFPSEKRAKMLGFMGMIWGIAGVAGPIVGGFFVDQLSWTWIFYFNIPFGIISIVMILAYFKEDVDKKAKSIDYAGAVTFAISIFSFLYALQKGSEDHDWASAGVVTLFAVFVVFLALFLYIETKAKEPLIPLNLFRIREISIANGISLLVCAILIGTMAYVPMWVQGLLGYSATQSGFITMPMSLTWMMGSFLCGRLMPAKGLRYTSVLGLTVLLGACGWLALMGASSNPANFYLITALQGIGFGTVLTLCTVVVQSSVDWTLRGAATSSNMFFRNLGQSIGVAVFGTYFNSRILSGIGGHPTTAGTIEAGQFNQLINPETAASLPPEIRSILQEVLISGIHGIFILILAIAALSLALSFVLPKRQRQARPAGSRS